MVLRSFTAIRERVLEMIVQKIRKHMARPRGRQSRWLSILIIVAVLIIATVVLSLINWPRIARAEEPDLSLIRAAMVRADANLIQTSGSPVVISAADFRPDHPSRQWFFPFGSGVIYPAGSAYCGTAPVTLPDGAKITSMTAYVYDNDVNSSVSLSLYPKPFKAISPGPALADVISSDSGSVQALTDSTIGTTGNPVDTSTYTYYLGLCMLSTSGTQQFHSVEIFMGYRNFLPSLLNDFCITYPGPFETEPNNAYSLANGLLCLDKTYQGNPDNNSGGPSAEDRDWFKFFWDGTGTLHVDVTNYLADAQVLLYHSSDPGTFLVRDFQQADGHYTLNYSGPKAAGTYYLQLYAPGGHPTGNGDYTLVIQDN